MTVFLEVVRSATRYNCTRIDRFPLGDRNLILLNRQLRSRPVRYQASKMEIPINDFWFRHNEPMLRVRAPSVNHLLKAPSLGSNGSSRQT
jgi:hypothetical protein